MKRLNARNVSMVLLAALLSACSHAPASKESEAQAEVNEAMKPLKAWADAIASRKTENVLKLYEDDAVQFAMFEPKPITNQTERKKHLDRFLQKKNLKVTYNQVFADIEDDVLTANGLYTFSYTQGNKTVKVPARFTFVFEKDDCAYEIEAHHSSLVPKK